MNAEVITIANFLADPNLDALYNMLANSKSEQAEPTPAATPAPTPAAPAQEAPKGGSKVFTKENILLGLSATDKNDAIVSAGELLVKRGYANRPYIQGMLDREQKATTCLGFGVAIPHGTIETKDEVTETGIVFLQYPEGVPFGDELVYLVFGIAAEGDGHLEILAQIADIVEDDDQIEILKTTKDLDKVMELLGGSL